MHERGDKSSPRIEMGEGVIKSHSVHVHKHYTQCPSKGEPHQNSTKDISQIL